MRFFQLTCIYTVLIFLTGCHSFSSKTAEPTLKEVEKNEPVVLHFAQKEIDEHSFGHNNPIIIEAEISSPIGESESYFPYEGDVPLKVSIANTGTKSFIYKIRQAENHSNVVDGVLESNESFVQIFDGLQKGAYVIKYVVEEEEPPVDIQLNVKIELLY